MDALDEQMIRQPAERARSQGPSLVGEGGLLQTLTRLVLESALEG